MRCRIIAGAKGLGSHWHDGRYPDCQFQTFHGRPRRALTSIKSVELFSVRPHLAKSSSEFDADQSLGLAPALASVIANATAGSTDPHQSDLNSGLRSMDT